jgi:hypothetical protein
MTSRLLRTAAALAASAFLASGAFAQAPATSATPVQTSSSETPFAANKAASTEVLDRATTREDISQVATSAQTSTVSGNSVNGDSVTGDIAFSDNAFQNASGLTVINANSGNNVSMNASLNVNIVMAPPPPPQQ